MDVENTKLRPYEKISQETRGGLIRSDNWNNNFNRVSDVIRDNNKIIEDGRTKVECIAEVLDEDIKENK